MSWFRVDDKFYEHPKAIRAGKDGRNLWFRIGLSCGSFNTDGRADGEIIGELAPQAGVAKWKAAVARLVEVELWHDHETLAGCSVCTDHLKALNADRRRHDEPEVRVGPGDYFFHQWWKYQEPRKARRSEAAKAAEDRARALRRDLDLCQQIQLRDRNRCRYCCTEVSWSDRRSPSAPTYDHIDPHCYAPNGGNFLDGIVTACRTCNGRKGQRTPEEWAADEKAPGHLLQPPYEPPPPSCGPVSSVTISDRISNPDLTQTPENLTGPPGFDPENLNRPSRDARPGPGQVGSDPGQKSGQVRAGPKRAGKGRARGGGGPGAGQARSGPGREPPSGGALDQPDQPPVRTSVDPVTGEVLS